MFINKTYWESPSSFTAENNENNNQQEELDMIGLNPSNQLMMTSEITQPSAWSQPLTNLWGEQNCMSDLNTDHKKNSNTP